MNEDLPEPFGQLTLRPAPGELRARVLAVVVRELASRKRPRWERRLQWAVAASLLLGIGLNLWQQRANEAWQTRVYGPMPVSRTIADVAGAVASVTDAQTGRLVQQQLSVARPPRPSILSLQSERYERLLRGLADPRSNVTL